MIGMICQKFKRKFLLGQVSQSSSEDKEDGLLTATDVIKEEVKKIENRLPGLSGDQAKAGKQQWSSAKSFNQHPAQQASSLTKTQPEPFTMSEPLTQSIMKMRSKPGSDLICMEHQKESLSDTVSAINLISFDDMEEQQSKESIEEPFDEQQEVEKEVVDHGLEEKPHDPLKGLILMYICSLDLKIQHDLSRM